MHQFHNQVRQRSFRVDQTNRSTSRKRADCRVKIFSFRSHDRHLGKRHQNYKSNVNRRKSNPPKHSQLRTIVSDYKTCINYLWENTAQGRRYLLHVWSLHKRHRIQETGEPMKWPNSIQAMDKWVSVRLNRMHTSHSHHYSHFTA